MRILIVEDEGKTGLYLRKGLTEAGYVADWVEDGISGQHQAETEDYDLLIVDVMLPGQDGWTLLQNLRRSKSTPVLFLTARDDVGDRIRGLELGADDYLAKPFDFVELTARVKSILRRARQHDSLMRREGEILPRAIIASQVWDMNFSSDTNVVDSAIRRLRSKLDDPFESRLIHTVRGMGYVLEVRSQVTP